MSASSSLLTRRERWPLVGVAAGITGALATVAFDIHAGGGMSGEVTTSAIIDDVSQHTAHLSIIFGYTTVALLLILSACWRVMVERRLPESVAAHVVSGALTAAAGALALGYGWKGAMSIYHPDGNEANAFDETGLYVYYILNDFGSWIGWICVTVAAGAFAWMGLKERTLPRWIGVISILPIIPAWGLMLATGLPGMGTASALWMIIAFAGLAFHTNPIRDASYSSTTLRVQAA